MLLLTGHEMSPPMCGTGIAGMVKNYCVTVGLVKIDLVHMQMTLFTHEGVKSSSYDDPFSHYDGFYSYF